MDLTSQLQILAVIAVLWLVPVLVVGWVVWTMIRIRREQRRLEAKLEAIEHSRSAERES